MENQVKSPLQALRNKIVLIEAIELAMLGFVFWILASLITIGAPDVGLSNLIVFFIMIEGGLLGSWLIYNLYIRIARAGGRSIDIALWVIATVVTASYTFWAWTILDINRWIIAKLFYRGAAPVEYAWSVRSKQIRKVWEANQITK
ncbi:MAG: hypothetical protein UZ14_CFX002002845 [Chloroflexi bacterium OLB14]|nr:MAG: hypothetical protein UZ14_CFX002002845 [Chloroflexi bacterium OLB14]